MRAKAKYAVIYRHREQYPVSVMCIFFSVPEAVIRLCQENEWPEKMLPLLKPSGLQAKCFHTYLRRMYRGLKGSWIYHNPKPSCVL